MFDTRLRAANTNSNRITQALWNSVVGSGASFPNAYAEPWSGAEPNEADLYELILDRSAPGASPASMAIGRVHARVDVQVHHRSGSAAPASQVRVTLLRKDVWGERRRLGGAAVPVARGGAAAAAQRRCRAGAQRRLELRRRRGQAVRSPAGPGSTRGCRASATFDADFSATAAAGRRVLLVAVVHSDADPATLAGASLQTVVLGSRFVALRSVEVV